MGSGGSCIRGPQAEAMRRSEIYQAGDMALPSQDSVSNSSSDLVVNESHIPTILRIAQPLEPLQHEVSSSIYAFDAQLWQSKASGSNPGACSANLLLNLPPEVYVNILKFLSIASLGHQDCLCRCDLSNAAGIEHAWQQRCFGMFHLVSPVGFRKVGSILVSNRTHMLMWKDLYFLRRMQPTRSMLQFKTGPNDLYVIPVAKQSKLRMKKHEGDHGGGNVYACAHQSRHLVSGAKPSKRSNSKGIRRRTIRRKVSGGKSASQRIQRQQSSRTRADHRHCTSSLLIDLIFSLKLFLVLYLLDSKLVSASLFLSNSQNMADLATSHRSNGAVGVALTIQDPITGSIVSMPDFHESSAASSNQEQRKVIQEIYQQISESYSSSVEEKKKPSEEAAMAASELASRTKNPVRAGDREVDTAMTARFGGTSSHDCVESTYGELLHSSLQSLVGPEYLNVTSTDRFMDLGSGRGATVLQASLAIKNLSLSAGIELSTDRHKTACRAIAKFGEITNLQTAAKSVIAIHADMFDVDWSLFTVFYVSALCFRSEMMREIAQRLAQTHKMGDYEKPIRVLSLRKLPIPYGGNVRLVQTTKTLATWGWTNAYIYHVGNMNGSLKKGKLIQSSTSHLSGSRDRNLASLIRRWRASLVDKCEVTASSSALEVPKMTAERIIRKPESQERPTQVPKDKESSLEYLINYYKREIENDADDTHALLRRGQLYQMAGDHRSAIRDFRAVYKFYVRAFRSSIALDHSQKIADEEFSCAMEGLAFSFLEMGDHMKLAEIWYLRLIRDRSDRLNSGSRGKNLLSYRHTSNAQASWYTNLGNAQLALGKIQEAMTQYRKSIQIDRTKPFPFDGMGRAILMKGHRSELNSAIKYFRLAVKLAPENSLFRQSLAAALSRSGQIQEAATEYASAIKLNDRLAAAYRGLGYCLVVIGREEDRLAAVGLFRKSLEIEPDDSQSKHFLRVLDSNDKSIASGTEVQASFEYTRTLFDSLAGGFDTRLLGDLIYKGPEIVMQALDDAKVNESQILGRVADLGCGTGLQGALLKSAGAKYIYGVDASNKMLRQARLKGCYDLLAEGDIVVGLKTYSKYFDTVVATDTFPYLADLDPIMSAAYGALVTGGRMVFTVERLEEKYHGVRGHVLQITGRVAHKASYVLETAQEVGFQVKLHKNTSTRKEQGVPVTGMVFVLVKN